MADKQETAATQPTPGSLITETRVLPHKPKKAKKKTTKNSRGKPR